MGADERPKSIQQVEVGGVDQRDLALATFIQDEYDRFAGNLQAMGGLGPQASTTAFVIVLRAVVEDDNLKILIGLGKDRVNGLDDDFFPVVSGRSTTMPAVNIREDEKRFTLDLAVPGIDKKDLKIEINEDVITISSEHKDEKEESRDDFKRKEFSYSSLPAMRPM